MKREDLCKSLIGKVVVVADGKNHSENPFRCSTENGIIGYYEKVFSFERDTSTFNNGRIKSEHVANLILFDIIEDCREILYELNSLLKNN